ncbi:MAG: DUF4276 family protein [Thermoguttaceae bacterium]|jgi:hypothetical protein|nr:DUF4276 family protein [Thermoguttaceae bacterium]
MTSDICRFLLVVTGKGEEEFLPDLFRVIMARACCTFRVIRRIGQRNPVTSSKRLAEMAGGRRTPDMTKDEQDIGLPVLGYLRRYPGSYAMVVDDLESDRRPNADAVFARYRTALDETLIPSGLQRRAAVFFLVNMLEAYYFADHRAVNGVAGTEVLSADHPSDVEQIRNPKADLKRLWKGFSEIRHGKQIVKRLDLEHVLSRPEECCWLRAMFAWCVAKLAKSNAIHDPLLNDAFCLADGCQASVTSGQ